VSKSNSIYLSLRY